MLQHNRTKLDVKSLSEVGWSKFFPQAYLDEHKTKELGKVVAQGIKSLQVSSKDWSRFEGGDGPPSYCSTLID